jgi:hypothetical protein
MTLTKIEIDADIAYAWVDTMSHGWRGPKSEMLYEAIEATRPKPWIEWGRGLKLRSKDGLVRLTCVHAQAPVLDRWVAENDQYAYPAGAVMHSRPSPGPTVEFDPEYWEVVG